MPLSESYIPKETSQQTWEKTFEQKINRSNLSKEQQVFAIWHMETVFDAKEYIERPLSQREMSMHKLRVLEENKNSLKNLWFSEKDIWISQAYIDKKYEQFWFEEIQDFKSKIKQKQYEDSSDERRYERYIAFLEKKGYKIETVSAEEIKEAKKQTRLNKIIKLRGGFSHAAWPSPYVDWEFHKEFREDQKKDNEGIAYEIFWLREDLVDEIGMTIGEVEEITGIKEKELRKYAPKYKKRTKEDILKFNP